MPVPDGIERQFADDAEDRVRRVVRENLARDVEPQLEIDRVDVRQQGQPDGAREILLLERAVAQVPDAVPEVTEGGVDRLEREIEMLP